MLTQLRAIFDLIIQFQSTQENMYNSALDELRARQRLDKLAEKRTDKVSRKEGFKTLLGLVYASSFKIDDGIKMFIAKTKEESGLLHSFSESPKSTILTLRLSILSGLTSNISRLQ